MSISTIPLYQLVRSELAELPQMKRSKTISTPAKRSRYQAPPKKYINKQLTRVNFGKGFPKTATFSHKYVELINFSSGTGIIGYYQFVCNGMFKPNDTGTGHQPYYYDQMAALYNHYTVIGSKIKVTASADDNAQASFMLSLSQNDDGTVTKNSYSAQAESPMGQIAISPASSASRVLTLSNGWSAKKTFGGSVLGNDNLQGSLNANPSEQTLWTIGITPCDGISTVGIDLLVEITYTAVWDEVRDVNTS